MGSTGATRAARARWIGSLVRHCARQQHFGGQLLVADVRVAQLACGGEDIAELVAGFALDDEDAPGFELAVIRHAHGEAEHGV